MTSLGGVFLRSTELGLRERELVILRVTAHNTASTSGAFTNPDWLSDAEVAATLASSPSTFTGRDALLISLADERCTTSRVSEALRADLAAAWPEAALVELIALVGSYTLISILANATAAAHEPWAARFPSPGYQQCPSDKGMRRRSRQVASRGRRLRSGAHRTAPRRGRSSGPAPMPPCQQAPTTGRARDAGWSAHDAVRRPAPRGRGGRHLESGGPEPPSRFGSRRWAGIATSTADNVRAAQPASKGGCSDHGRHRPSGPGWGRMRACAHRAPPPDAPASVAAA